MWFISLIYFFLAPEIEKTYTSDNKNNVVGDLNIFWGIWQPLGAKIETQTGFSVSIAGPARFSGYIWDDVSPLFNNYIYGYKVKHAHVALEGKLLAQVHWLVTPWIGGSVGVGI